MRLNRFAAFAFAITLAIVTFPLPVLSQEPAPPPAPTHSAPPAPSTAPVEEPEGSFFDSTTVTALGREVDVFQVSTPVTVIRGNRDRPAPAEQRRRPAARRAGRGRQRRRRQSGPPGDSRPARPAHSLHGGRPAHEQRAAADRLRRALGAGRRRRRLLGRGRARPDVGALRQRRHRRRAQPGHQAGVHSGRPQLRRRRRPALRLGGRTGARTRRRARAGRPLAILALRLPIATPKTTNRHPEATARSISTRMRPCSTPGCRTTACSGSSPSTSPTSSR